MIVGTKVYLINISAGNNCRRLERLQWLGSCQHFVNASL